MKVILNENPDNDNYGVERMKIALLQRGIQVSHRTVYRAMQESELLHKRRIPHGITKATTTVQKEKNLIKRNFGADVPLEKFLTDISEFPYADGKL